MLLFSSCSSETQGEWKRARLPDPASEQGEHILRLWQGAWVAALLTGSRGVGPDLLGGHRPTAAGPDDEIPIQTRYNLPLEIFYTIAPIIMVIVFFSQTVQPELVLDDERREDAASRSSASSGPGRSTTASASTTTPPRTRRPSSRTPPTSTTRHGLAIPSSPAGR